MKRTRTNARPSTRREDNVIGFDPLAWMREEAGGAPVDAPERGDTPRAGAGGGAAEVVALGPALTIEQAASVHAELSGRIGAGRVVLAAAELARVDTAGLQLLTAFVRAARERGTGVEWRAPSAALRDGARLLGLEAALGLETGPARSA